MHGIPVAVKDEAWTAGLASTGGSLVFAHFTPSRDGTVAARLRAAGAIIIGKTQLPEFAAWPRSRSRLAPESVNPWDRSRISGASSGGSAAAVAAGLVPLAVGSDGGGSIRIPSALCGTVGLYPTAGRVSCYGSFSYSPLGSFGPMARTVADTALLYMALAGPDRRDPWTLPDPPADVMPALERGVEGMRIGWTADFGHVDVDLEVRDTVERAVSVLAQLGALVDPTDHAVPHPWGDGAWMATFQSAVAALPSDDWEGNEPAPDVVQEEAWLWSVFDRGIPLTTTPEFQALCRRHADLLTPPSRLRVREHGAVTRAARTRCARDRHPYGTARSTRPLRRGVCPDDGVGRSCGASGMGEPLSGCLHGHQPDLRRQHHPVYGRLGSVRVRAWITRRPPDHRPARGRSNSASGRPSLRRGDAARHVRAPRHLNRRTVWRAAGVTCSPSAASAAVPLRAGGDTEPGHG